ncbi:MAG: cation:proton antiporter [Phycisphaerae bacterium]|nr:cation:proton antiporter [Phycisphaerae bacterium]
MILRYVDILAAAQAASHGIVTQVGTTFALLLLAAAVLAFCKRTKLPFTVMLVLVGVALAHLAGWGPAFLRTFANFRISPEVILFVFLPTLIFESAFNLEARRLQHNLLPVLTLAIPGLLLSTAIIGAIVAALADIPLAAALLLGAILSATDPVAVISLFKELGAPKRLTVLVEGESLFNDATSLVLAGILVEAVRHGPSSATAFHGVLEFLVVFFGGALVGLVLAGVFGFVLGKVKRDPFIAISLTTILAYASFLIAEHVLHVSGVMATVMAGLLMGGWGRTKIAPSVAGYLHDLWEFLAYVANALIFLLVGLSVVLSELWSAIGVLACTVLAMLVSRAAVVFGLVPLAGRFSEPVERRYQAVMYWGGLRGAIALAIALQLPEGFAYRETFIAVVSGAVLFTLLVQGLSIETLVHRLGLDKPPPSDALARVEGLITAKQKALDRIPDLQAGGLFSPRIADLMKDRCEREMDDLLGRMKIICNEQLDPEHERRVIYLRCFAQEKAAYFELFSRRHISERTYRNLAFSLELQTEAMRHQGRLLRGTLLTPRRRQIYEAVPRALEVLPGCGGLARRLRAERTAREYERAWSRHWTCARVLTYLDEMPPIGRRHAEIVGEVCAQYESWLMAARARLDNTAAQFPEFVRAMQKQLAERLVVHTQREAIHDEVAAGMIPAGVAEKLLQLDERIPERWQDTLLELHVDPAELLRKVPLFQDTPPEEFARVAALLRERTTPSGEIIIRQGEMGDSLFLIARGVVRVVREHDGGSKDLATFVAGEFFGEVALLSGSPRSATCRTVTPCALYELRKEDLDEVCAVCPTMRRALEQAAREHQAGNA